MLDIMTRAMIDYIELENNLAKLYFHIDRNGLPVPQDGPDDLRANVLIGHDLRPRHHVLLSLVRTPTFDFRTNHFTEGLLTARFLPASGRQMSGSPDVEQICHHLVTLKACRPYF